MDKFRNKYRIQSTRLQNWDYRRNAAYFVTICTANRECYFGKIDDGNMELSEIGEIAEKYWIEIPDHFPFVELDEYVIMPNHIHGILVIDKPENEIIKNTVETPESGVSTNIASEKWKFDSLGVIINQYKRICTINSRKINSNFGWQSRFYDHIIRNDKSFQRIRNYIINNPLNWDEDKLYKE